MQPRSGSGALRDDLLHAQAALDWAVSQIPIFQEKLAAWNAKGPYEISIELDPQTGDHLLVANLLKPLDPLINAEVGVIINSIRAALDFLAASLCRRNGKKPNADTHFPIFESEQCMIDPLTGIEGKKWLSKRERAAIKALKPYHGGDDTIWPLHQLDRLRKHERLISARADVSSFHYQGGTASGESGYMFIGGLRGIASLEDKTILNRFRSVAPPFDAAQSHTHVAAFVVFNEAKIGLVDQEVATTLLRFASRVADIIKIFDA
jgi:hypothetical protein